MNDIASGVPAGSIAEFAAAQYKDKEFCSSDPFAFDVDQNLTTNTGDVQNGINTWSAGGGCDTPESWINALWQIANGAINFRSGSTRVVVQFGDATTTASRTAASTAPARHRRLPLPPAARCSTPPRRTTCRTRSSPACTTCR